jgi:glycosyltransferase involved in cell wall biosynthesis
MKQPANTTLFFDVTQLIHWPGKLTGIPRVMNELAIRFAEAPETVFVAWVKEVQQFCEIDFGKTMAQRGRGIVYVKVGQTAPVEMSAAAPTTPTQAQLLQKQVLRIVKGLLRRGARFNHKLAAKIEDWLIAARASQYKVADIKPGDKLFIPWGEWWDDRFAKRLVELHADGVKLVHIIHDIATTVCPQFYEQVSVKPTDYNAKILPLADLVLAVSHNTKRELTEWLKANKLHVPRIEVFRNGEDLQVAKPIRPLDPAFDAAKLRGKDFILTVGTIELKKNHLLYYYAYKLAKGRGIELPQLVVVGRKGWMGETALNLMRLDPEVKDKFVLLLDTSDEELSWLYDNCLFTVLASFHEGWGIPIAESVARGVPCLCSNTSSMVEIAEGFVEHFSPESPEELLAGIQRWLEPKALAKARANTQSYKQFSWDASYKQVATLLKENL